MENKNFTTESTNALIYSYLTRIERGEVLAFEYDRPLLEHMASMAAALFDGMPLSINVLDNKMQIEIL